MSLRLRLCLALLQRKGTATVRCDSGLTSGVDCLLGRPTCARSHVRVRRIRHGHPKRLWFCGYFGLSCVCASLHLQVFQIFQIVKSFFRYIFYSVKVQTPVKIIKMLRVVVPRLLFPGYSGFHSKNCPKWIFPGFFVYLEVTKFYKKTNMEAIDTFPG